MFLTFAHIFAILSTLCRSVSTWFNFSTPWGTSINNSNDTGLLEIKSSTFFKKKLKMSLFHFHFEKIFTGIEILGWLFSFQYFKDLIHYFLAPIISDEKLLGSLIVPLVFCCCSCCSLPNFLVWMVLLSLIFLGRGAKV